MTTMRDFYAADSYAASSPAPLDQADGLRRMFRGQAMTEQRLLPLVANPHVAFGSVVLDRLAGVLAAGGRQVLVVDAGAGAPAHNELAGLDLAVCIETVAPRVGYLPARGLPLSFVDTRGSAGSFISALHNAAPWADVVLLHAEASELARVLARRSARPLLIGADHPESIKHAYASAKLLVQRCGLMTYDLLLAASAQSPRLGSISSSLARCADSFLGALLHHTAVVDPAGDPAEAADEALRSLLVGQLTLSDSPWDAWGDRDAPGARPQGLRAPATAASATSFAS
jgi:flagellar biosynthesis protein FlhG